MSSTTTVLCVDAAAEAPSGEPVVSPNASAAAEATAHPEEKAATAPAAEVKATPAATEPAAKADKKSSKAAGMCLGAASTDVYCWGVAGAVYSAPESMHAGLHTTPTKSHASQCTSSVCVFMQMTWMSANSC